MNGKKSPPPVTRLYEVDHWYSITVCPNDGRQYIRKQDRMQRCKSYMYEQMLPLAKHHIDYKLWMDISEPRKVMEKALGPRIHWHGVIKFRHRRGILYWLLYGMNNIALESIIEIDSIDDMPYWLEYCQKYVTITKSAPLENSSSTSVEDGSDEK